MVQQVHLARRGLRAAPSGDRQALVGQPVHRGDLRLEARWTQVRQVVVGVDPGQRQPVARCVEGALALLAAGRRHPHHVRLRAEHGVGHQGEVGGAGRLPGQGDLLSAAAFEVVDAQRVVAGGQLDRPVLGFRAVQPVVVDDELVVDQQLRAIVAGEPEGVGAVLRHVDVGGDLADEIGLEAEVLGGGEVDVRFQLVDVRGLARLERAELAQRDLHVEDAQCDPGFLRGQFGGGRLRIRVRRAGGQTEGRGAADERGGQGAAESASSRGLGAHASSSRLVRRTEPGCG